MNNNDPLILLEQAICNSEDLEESGLALRFQIRAKDVTAWKSMDLNQSEQAHPAFVLRFKGEVYAYLNRCAHVHMEMDWRPGQLFSLDKQHLICATHDAHYLPDTGVCVAGPCPRGSSLVRVNIEEREGRIYLLA